MAKNTSSSAFRKIDVDQYNENNFREEDLDVAGAMGPDENEVNALMADGKLLEALVAVLQNAPLRCKQQHIKVSIQSFINELSHTN